MVTLGKPFNRVSPIACEVFIMAKEITDLINIYERSYKDMSKKLIKSLKSKRVSIGDLLCFKSDFSKFCEIYNNLIYLKAGLLEVK